MIPPTLQFEMPPQAPGDVVLQPGTRQVAEYRLHLFQDADVVVLPVVLQTATIVCRVRVQVELFFAAEVFVRIGGGALASQKAFAYTLHHVQLL